MAAKDAIIDISPRLSPAISTWPGDTAFTREVLLDMKRGDSITLSTMRSTVHLGSHADAPSHYSREGRTMEQQPLELYWGRCEVVRLREGATVPGRRVAREHLAIAPGWVPTCVRLLIATGSYPNPDSWKADFLALEPSFVDWLADAGVRLVGIDTPSVDCADSKDLPAHARFAAREVAIIEGLVLAHVEPGEYELCALPLALEGFDASPIRAALRRV